ncbi:MAG: 3-deoxy-manno-octulosonate cytidylyltransferase [Gammaproteobacteria bacterium]|nr:3-deoxy-manno-octulosonate cytidylyltransferase [Gammaproteobacteria bacterium]
MPRYLGSGTLVRYRVVIPARYGSTRLPGKPLIDIAGKPMIVRVAEQALRSRATGVVVATDDGRVVEALRGSGAEATLTRDDHRSGSDRVMEVVDAKGWPDDEVVVNVQGDEPLIPPVVIDHVAGLIDDECEVATLGEPITAPGDVFDPNIVKVVADRRGRALYFSRAPIPWHRDTFGRTPPQIGTAWRRHIGIYAYRAGALRAFVSYPPSRLEEIEALEQLRLMDHGHAIAVAEAAAPVPGGVDTPADVDRVLDVLRGVG